MEFQAQITTLLVDLGNGRLTVIDPEGIFVRWIPMVRALEGGRTRSIHPRWVDEDGFLYLMAPYDPDGSPPDSTGLNRLDLSDQSETVVGWSWHPDFSARRRGGRRPIFGSSDDWAVGMDGRVAVVRVNGYSVDWYFPDGRTAKGPPNEVEAYPVGQADKEAEVEFMGSEAIMTFVTAGREGERSRRTRRGVPPGSMPALDEFEWPETLPIFRTGGTLVSPQGEAWVRRITPSGTPSRYEVFDSAGARQGFAALPPGSTIIGFGTLPETEGTAYLTRTDELGLVSLERHRVRRNRR